MESYKSLMQAGMGRTMICSDAAVIQVTIVWCLTNSLPTTKATGLSTVLKSKTLQIVTEDYFWIGINILCVQIRNFGNWYDTDEANVSKRKSNAALSKSPS